MEQTTQTMGKRIAAHRKRLGLTQDQLAEQLGVSPQAVSKWENDISCPDISTLPRLAEIFGISTDELLGVAPKEPVYESEVVTDSQKPGEKSIEVQLPSGRLNGIFFALWVIAMGAMLIAGRLLELPFGFWTAAWTTGLFIFGLRSLVREFHFFGLAAAAAGGYFILSKLELIPEVRSWDIVWPILILVAGLCLLVDALTQKRRKTVKIPSGKAGRSRSSTQDGTFTFDDSFGEHTLEVNAPVLRGGDVSVSFGEHTLSLTGVGKVAPGCTVSVNNSFGELRILVPKRFRAEADLSKAFANFEIHGQPAERTEGTISFQVDTNFGETTITYV